MSWLNNKRQDERKETLRKNARGKVEKGIFLGSMSDGKKTIDLLHDTECSGAIVSPPGGGKSSKVLIPTLLSDPGTFVVFSPALDLYQTTYKRRLELGNDVVVLCPFPDDANEVLHPDHQLNDHGINLFGNIDFKNRPETVREEIKNRIQLLIPDKIKTDDKSRYFQQAGRQMLDFVSLWQLHGGRELTLPDIRIQLLSGFHVLHDACVEAMDSSAFAGELALLGGGLSSILTASPEQFAGGYGYASDAVDLYDGYSSVGRHVTGGGFDPARLKSGKPVTVYVCYPGERVCTHSRMATATITYLLQQVCKGRPGNFVKFLVDEASELELPLARFMNQGRKHNLAIFPAFQELEGQIASRYGTEGVKEILSASELLWITSLRGPDTCRTFSDILGSKAVEAPSLNDRPGTSSPMPDQSFGRSYQTVPVMRPDELRQLDRRKAIVIVGNEKPLMVDKVGYFERPDFAAVAGPNPYRG